QHRVFEQSRSDPDVQQRDVQRQLSERLGGLQQQQADGRLRSEHLEQPESLRWLQHRVFEQSRSHADVQQRNVQRQLSERLGGLQQQQADGRLRSEHLALPDALRSLQHRVFEQPRSHADVQQRNVRRQLSKRVGGLQREQADG